MIGLNPGKIRGQREKPRSLGNEPVEKFKGCQCALIHVSIIFRGVSKLNKDT